MKKEEKRGLSPFKKGTVPFFERAHKITRQRFGKTIQLYAPLYVSNECTSTCTYCGFSMPNRVPRKTLTVQEAVREANFLIDKGFRHLLLVSGDHPKKVSPEYLSEITKAIRPRLGSLSVEVSPFDYKGYKTLTEAGVDGICIYQETYDRERYCKLHLAGPKKDYDKRLKTIEHAAEAGMRKICLGILLGLADWRKDATALVQHLCELRKKYWQCDYIISLPRLRPCASDFKIEYPITDQEFVQLVAALRITLPEVGISISTRESPAMRNYLIQVGATQLSAGSRTEPGGYLHPNEAEEQFKLEDHRDPFAVANDIASRGLEPVWKDWDQILHG